MERLFVKDSQELQDSLLEDHFTGINQIGNLIQKREAQGFAFIDSNSNQYFAHKNDFIDITDWVEWKNLKEGSLVTFEIGSNPKGECAKNIKLT